MDWLEGTCIEIDDGRNKKEKKERGKKRKEVHRLKLRTDRFEQENSREKNRFTGELNFIPTCFTMYLI